MLNRQVLDRLIVLVAVVGVMSPGFRGNAVSVVDARASGIPSTAAFTPMGCVTAEPRFPVVFEVPFPGSSMDSAQIFQVEMKSIELEQETLDDVGAEMKVDELGRAVAVITWQGSSSVRRAPVGTYEVNVTSSMGRSSTCVTVARPVAVKSADRPSAPVSHDVEVIVIGRETIRGGKR